MITNKMQLCNLKVEQTSRKMKWNIGLKYLLGWERLPLFGRFGYVEMTKFLMIPTLLLCRLSTDAPSCYVHGRLYSMWRTETCLRRCLHGWRSRRGIFLPNMGGNITSKLDLLRHLRRRYSLLVDYLYCAFFLCIRTVDLNGCVMQRPSVMLKTYK